MDKTKGIWMAMAVAGLLAFAGCSHFESNKVQTWTLSASPNVPAAEGRVQVQPGKGPDHNQALYVSVDHMAPADKAFPGMTSYVVWVIPQGGQPPQNLGVLNVGENLKGELKGSTPYKTFDVLVTAEDSGKVTHPSDNRIFNTSIQVPT